MAADVEPALTAVGSGDVSGSAAEAATLPMPSEVSNDIELTESSPPTETVEISSHQLLESSSSTAAASAETAAETPNDAGASAAPVQAEVSSEASAAEPGQVQDATIDTFDTADAAKSASAEADEKIEEEVTVSDASSPVRADDIQV